MLSTRFLCIGLAHVILCSSSSARESDKLSKSDVGGLKGIELTDNVQLSLGGSSRQRFEYFEGFGFGVPATSEDVYFVHRFQAHADLQVGDHMRLFVEGISAFGFDRDLPGEDRSADTDNIDILNAFLDLEGDFGETSALLRLGRQQLSFGKQRLVSPLPWLNTYNKWDGASLIVELEGWRAHGFATYYTPVDRFDLNEADEDNQFYGVYLTKGKDLDFYYLLRRLGESDTERHTIGVRKSGNHRTFDYDFEGAYQFGSEGDGDIAAWMAATEIGYRPESSQLIERLWLGFDVASGDGNPNDDEIGTFDHLFPLAHAYFGSADVLGRQNIIDLSGGNTFRLTEKWSARLAGHLFWRAETADGIYSPSGSLSRSANGSDSHFVGSEIDISSSYQLTEHLTLGAGYSRFIAGDFISETGSSEDVNFAWSQLTWTF